MITLIILIQTNELAGMEPNSHTGNGISIKQVMTNRILNTNQTRKSETNQYAHVCDSFTVQCTLFVPQMFETKIVYASTI